MASQADLLSLGSSSWSPRLFWVRASGPEVPSRVGLPMKPVELIGRLVYLLGCSPFGWTPAFLAAPPAPDAVLVASLDRSFWLDFFILVVPLELVD